MFDYVETILIFTANCKNTTKYMKFFRNTIPHTTSPSPITRPYALDAVNSVVAVAVLL